MLTDLITELIGWFIVSALILPGAVVTALLDQITPLDRGQLWALSLLFSGIVFVGLAYVLARMERQSDLLIWYGALVIFLAIGAGVASFGFKATSVGAFLSRFPFGSALFNLDLWMPTVIRIAMTSVIALTGTVAVLLGRSVSIVLGRVQVWMLAVLMNGVCAYGVAWWGPRKQWFLFENDPDFPQSMFDAAVTASLLVVMVNVLVMAVGVLLYYGVRVSTLAVLFEQMAPVWPTWMSG